MDASYLPEALPPATETPTSVGSKVILLAEHSGFCHGVKKAVNKTIATHEANPNKATYVLGDLIHNPQEIARLKAMGIETVKTLEEVPSGSVCVIRTHGAPPELYEAAEAKGIAVSDATCPDVSLVQEKAIELAKEGYTVVLVGHENHPEIIGISAHAKQVAGAHVVAIRSPEEIEEKLKDLPKRRLGVVSQTTQLEDSFFTMVKHLSMVAKELKVFNTICPATYFRQHAAMQLAKQVQLMIVVGGKHSSNTTHLAELCKELGTPALHIETWQELEQPEAASALAKAKTLGLTAGASTPDWLVEDVLAYLKQC
jgi:(E)-4-hydroxy-3-methyl-but-2-enyl pyrophosphate reductase